MSDNGDPFFVAGLDLGQAADYTALAILELVGQGEQAAAYHCRHLQRYPLGTLYPDIATNVRALLGSPALRGRCPVVVDAGGVGRAIVDLLMQAAAVPCIAVTIHGGDTVTGDPPYWRVPKRDLVGTLQVLLQTERLKFAADLPEAPTLVKELLAYQVKISPLTAHDSYNAREGAHDDLVLALALAAWWPEYLAAQPVTVQEIIYRPIRIGPQW